MITLIFYLIIRSLKIKDEDAKALMFLFFFILSIIDGAVIYQLIFDLCV